MKNPKSIISLLNEIDQIMIKKLTNLESEYMFKIKEHINNMNTNGIMLEQNKLISEIKHEIYKKLNQISEYELKDDKDYEIIAKVITNAHDIVVFNDRKIKNQLDLSLKTMLRLPEEIREYFIPFKSFSEIKNIKVEGKEKFDGEGSYINYNTETTNNIYAQATKTKDILDQTELIFKTSEIEEVKKVYIISEDYPKKEIENFFKIIDEELLEKFEILRFLALSIKVYSDKIYTKNKNVEYFFSIIFFSSKGFNNQFNIDMYKIYYDESFDFLKLLENRTKKQKNEEIRLKINEYLENLFKYFNDNLIMESFDKGCTITDSIKTIINQLNILLMHVEKGKQKKLIEDKIKKISINKNIMTIIENETKKGLLHKIQKSLIKNQNKKISSKMIGELNFKKDYNEFAKELEEALIKDLNINTNKENKIIDKFTDEEILKVVFFDNGKKFQNFLYAFKNKTKDLKKDLKYEEVKDFKKSFIKRIFKIFSNLDVKHYIFFNEIYSDILLYNNKNLQNAILEGFSEVVLGKTDETYKNNLKIFLLTTLFYPTGLKSMNYKKIIDCILKYELNYFKKNESLEIIAQKYLKQKNSISVVEFLSNFNLARHDLFKLYKILEEKNILNDLRIYIKQILQELPMDLRLQAIENIRYYKIMNNKKYDLIRMNSCNDILKNNFYLENYLEMIKLKKIFFELYEKNGNELLSIFYIIPEEFKKGQNYNINYCQINSKCNRENLSIIIKEELKK